MLARHWRHRDTVLLRWLMPVLGLCVLVGVAIAVAVGSVAIPLADVFAILGRWLVGAPLDAYADSTVSIVTMIRLPRVLLVALTGAALSASGAAYQGFFRNPLADPYIIGVASGAGFGAMLVVVTGLTVWLGAFAQPIGAFCGALMVVLTVAAFAQRRTTQTTHAMILAGIAIGMLASAATTYLMLRAGAQATRLLGFLLGSAAAIGWESVFIVAGSVVIGMVALLLVARDLNTLLGSEEYAMLLGIDVRTVRRLVVFGATVMTATAVAFHGLIGFVGIIVPHTLRLVSGGDNRRLIPLSALAGAVFLVASDVVARTIAAPQEIPLGIVTACLGSPVFLFLLLRTRP